MNDTVLSYAQPGRFRYEWRFLRGTAFVSTFVIGWTLFSSYVWLLYGNWAIGWVPVLRRGRDMAFPMISEVTVWMSAANLLWLIVLLFYYRRSWRPVLHYLAFALLPITLLLLSEDIVFGDFTVA